MSGEMSKKGRCCGDIKGYFLLIWQKVVFDVFAALYGKSKIIVSIRKT